MIANRMHLRHRASFWIACAIGGSRTTSSHGVAHRAVRANFSSAPDATNSGMQSAMFEAEKQISLMQHALRDAITSGRLDTAAQLAADAKKATFELYGRNHPASASALNNEALVAKQRGDLEAALNLYNEALVLYEKLVGKKHKSYAATLSNIGLALCALAQSSTGVEALGHADSAKAYLEGALQIRESELPPGDSLLAVTRYQLASALRLGKHYTKAERLLQQAVSELRASVGTNHPFTATALNNLGFLLKEMKKYDGALAAYEEAVQIRASALGGAHHDTITALHNLSECKRAAGDEPGALAVQQSILLLMRVEGEGADEGPSGGSATGGPGCRHGGAHTGSDGCA